MKLIVNPEVTSFMFQRGSCVVQSTIEKELNFFIEEGSVTHIMRE